jgi:hypothetical protein
MSEIQTSVPSVPVTGMEWARKFELSDDTIVFLHSAGLKTPSAALAVTVPDLIKSGLDPTVVVNEIAKLYHELEKIPVHVRWAVNLGIPQDLGSRLHTEGIVGLQGLCDRAIPDFEKAGFSIAELQTIRRCMWMAGTDIRPDGPYWYQSRGTDVAGVHNWGESAEAAEPQLPSPENEAERKARERDKLQEFIRTLRVSSSVRNSLRARLKANRIEGLDEFFQVYSREELCKMLHRPPVKLGKELELSAAALGRMFGPHTGGINTLMDFINALTVGEGTKSALNKKLCSLSIESLDDLFGTMTLAAVYGLVPKSNRTDKFLKTLETTARKAGRAFRLEA